MFYLAELFYDSIHPRNPQSNVSHPIVPMPQSGLGAKSVNFGANPQSLSSNNNNVPPQPQFLQHMMLGGNYLAQQNPDQGDHREPKG